MAKAGVQVSVYIYSDELRKALKEYAKDKKTHIKTLVEDAWSQFLASSDKTLAVSSKKTDNYRFQMLIMADPELVGKIDDLSLELDTKRQMITREAMRRYIEPLLLKEGYLQKSVLINRSLLYDKALLGQALRTFRKDKNHLSCDAFIEKYLIKPNGKKYVSHSHYCLIEKGKGNVEKIIAVIAQKTGIDKNYFYNIAKK